MSEQPAHSRPGVIAVREALPAVLPTRRAGLEVAEFDTEFVVWDPTSKMVHHLEGVAAILFDACDGSTGSAELLAEIAEATGVTLDAVTDEVTTVWQMYNRRDLLATPEPPARPTGQAGRGRRKRA